MEWLTPQLVVPGVQESDNRPGFAEVAPRALNDVALPPRLFRREFWGSVFAKGLGSTTTLIGC
jgi:hypothetical protein